MRNTIIIYIVILFSSFNIKGQVPTDSLMGYWPFSGNANDMSINNNNGAVIGATLTTDRFGLNNRAYHFNGANNYISIPQSATLNMNDSLSFSVWVKPETLTETRMVFGKSNYVTATNYLLRVKPNGYIQWEYDGYTDTDSVPLQLNTWHHIVVTASAPGQIKRVYIDNQLIKETITSSGPFGLVSNPLTIGARSIGGEYFNGAIDDIRMYNKVLTEMEIDALFNESCNSISNITETACDSYTAPDGQVYTTSGLKTAVIPNAAGCDSTITIDLTISYSSTNSITETACYSYTAPDGAIYTASGTETAIISNAAGCDSVITINLTIDTVDVSVSQNGVVLTANATNASYQWLDCDNGYALVDGETNPSFTAIQNGNYAVQVIQNACVDTSACYAVTTVGILENTFRNNIRVFPNPTGGILSVDLGESLAEFHITIIDTNGKIIKEENYQNTQEFELNLNVQSGIYLLMIRSENAKATIKLIKH
jgi:hypothetical protein